MEIHKKNALLNVTLSFSILIVITRSVTPPWIGTNWLASNNFFSLYTSQENVFARTWDGLNGGRVFLTADDSANWIQISSADSNIDILSIVMLNSGILTGTWDGLYLSTDSGMTWNPFTPPGIPADSIIWSLAMIDTTLFAGTTGDIYKSLDDGNTWTEVSSGIPVDARIITFIESGDTIITASASSGILKTTNGGVSWTEINSGLTDMHISQLAAIDSKLYAVTLSGVFVSDDGLSWVADSSSPENVNCFVVVNNELFAGTDDNGVFLSSDSGATWTSVSSGMPTDTRVWSLAASSHNIYAGTDSGVWRIPIDTASYSLTVTLSGNGSGTVTSNDGGIDCGTSCSYDFAYDTIVTLSASASQDSVFSGWSGEGCSGTETCTVSMTVARSVTASFVLAPYKVFLPLVLR